MLKFVNGAHRLLIVFHITKIHSIDDDMVTFCGGHSRVFLVSLAAPPQPTL